MIFGWIGCKESSSLKIVTGHLKHKSQKEDMIDATWLTLNKKAITYIKMTVSDEILVDLKGLTNAFAMWGKLKAMYENTTPVNQVHLMRKLVGMQLDKSKTAGEHLLLFTGRRKVSGEGGNSANMVRGRTEKKNAYAQRSKSKSKERGNASKGKGDVTCYQCGRKGHKKPDYRYYKAELERKKSDGDKRKEKKEVKTDAQDNTKGKGKANVASSVVIEELSDVEDILCATLSADDAHEFDASLSTLR